MKREERTKKDRAHNQSFNRRLDDLKKNSPTNPDMFNNIAISCHHPNRPAHRRAITAATNKHMKEMGPTMYGRPKRTLPPITPIKDMNVRCGNAQSLERPATFSISLNFTIWRMTPITIRNTMNQAKHLALRRTRLLKRKYLTYDQNHSGLSQSS